MHRLLALLCLCGSLFAQIQLLQPQIENSQPGRLTGRWFIYNGKTESVIAQQFAEARSIGVDTIITVGARIQIDPSAGACKGTYWDYTGGASESNIEAVFRQAALNNLQVIFGLLVNPSACFTAYSDAAEAQRFAQQITADYGHYGSLAGWFDGEPYLMGDSTWYAGVTQDMINYLGPLARGVKSVVPLKFYTAPYLVSWPGTPELAAQTAKQFLDATGIDVLIYQDYLGSRWTSTTANLGWNGAVGIREFFSAISQAVGREHLWADHEIWCAGAVRGSWNWIAAPVTRVNQQILQTDAAVSKHTTWLDEEFDSDTGPNLQAGAHRLFAGYKATHGLGGRKFPLTDILWVTQPDPKHPDDGLTPWCGRKLVDGIAGDALNPSGSEWVWVPQQRDGNVAFLTDLGEVGTVDFVSLHVAQNSGLGLMAPQGLIVYGSADGQSWKFGGAVQEAFLPVDGEFVLGNEQALNFSGVRFLYCIVVAPKGMAVSEVEVVGR